MSEKLIFFNRIKKIIAGSTVPYPERENPWLEIGYITYYEDSYKVYLSF